MKYLSELQYLKHLLNCTYKHGFQVDDYETSSFAVLFFFWSPGVNITITEDEANVTAIA